MVKDRGKRRANRWLGQPRATDEGLGEVNGRQGPGRKVEVELVMMKLMMMVMTVMMMMEIMADRDEVSSGNYEEEQGSEKVGVVVIEEEDGEISGDE